MFGKLLRLIFKEATVEAIKEGVKAFIVLPPVVGAITGTLAIMDKLPWSIVLLTAILAFAGTASGLLRFEQWRFTQRVVGKLAFNGPLWSSELTSQGKAQLMFGFFLHNSAHFATEFDVKELRTEILGRFPQKKPYTTTRQEVPGPGIGWFADYPIEIEVPANQTAEATMEFVVKYGRPGALKHSLHKKIRIVLHFDAAGVAFMRGWNDVTASLSGSIAAS
jgi:hypothetical protein